MKAMSLSNLSHSDLSFVVRTVATERTDHEHVIEIVKDKPDFLEVMLEDDKLFERVTGNPAILLSISPRLLFSILLRRARKELQRKTHTLETTSEGQRVPVFDSDQVVSFLSDEQVRDYLVDMLSSFTRTESTTVYFKEGNRLRRRSYSDMDLDDMITLSSLVDDEFRFPFHKRMGDICLFLVGVFPEHVESTYRYPLTVEGRPRIAGRKRRSSEDYEQEGRRFYKLAAEDKGAKTANLDTALHQLSENFNLATKPLNLISARYIHLNKFKWFASSI